MQSDINEKLQEAIWVANKMFDCRLVTGSCGNISFLHDNQMYISKSGSCFGRLDYDSFAIISLDGSIISGNPSKEYPMHLFLYQLDDTLSSVIHTHSLFCTMLSCMKDASSFINRLYAFTPYLSILTNGSIKIVPYCAPGSKELFDAFKRTATKTTNAYLLKNHGIVVSAKSLLQAFYIVEEFEIAAKLQHHLLQYASDDCNYMDKTF